MIAVIGAVGRLSDAGVDFDDAMDTVLRIVHEEQSGAPDDGSLDRLAAPKKPASS